MAWLKSHQELRNHPKTRKAARRANCSLPEMIGHLHLLWWWAMDQAPDGDLSKFDPEDIAYGAGYEGDDPLVFINALVDCGSGGGAGFLEDDWRLHDWDQYGGLYRKRSEAASKAARSRWQSENRADEVQPASDKGAQPVQSQSDSNADAMRSHSERNSEERRGEEKRKNLAPAKPPRKPDPIWDAVVEACGIDSAEMTKSLRGSTNNAVSQLKSIGATPEGIKARAKRHLQQWPDVTLTPTSLAKNYALLGAKPPGQGQSGGWR